MPNPRSVEAKPFYQASLQRLEDARVLLDRGRTTGAVYMAGYGVECVLKALLLERTPRPRRVAILASFRGQIAHNFDWLKYELRLTGFDLDRFDGRVLLRVRSWTTDLRYSAKRMEDRKAKTFLHAAVQMHEFVERQF